MLAGDCMSKSIEVISRGLMTQGSLILACRNDAGGYYYLPGGHVDFGEGAGDALCRELAEEAELHVDLGELALMTEGSFQAGGKLHHEINIVFHVKHSISGQVKSRESEISFHWLDVASLANLDLRPASIKAWLMAGGTGPSWISDFPTKAV